MNRRKLFRILPALSLAMIPTTTEDKTKPEVGMGIAVIDPRPTFMLSDFAMILSFSPSKDGESDWECPTHGLKHRTDVYTRGCHPVAFPLALVIGNWDAERIIPATEDSVPVDLECPTEGNLRDKGSPHFHNEFRWI